MTMNFPHRFSLLGALALIVLAFAMGFMFSALYETEVVGGFAVWAALSAGAGILYVLLVGLVRQGHRLIQANQGELQRSRVTIQSQRMDLLHRIGASAVNESGVGAVLREVTQDVRRLLDLPRCAIRLFGDPDEVVESCAPGVPSAVPAFPERLRDSDLWPVYEGGSTVVVNDIRECPCHERRKERLAEVSPGALLGVPLRIRDRFAGILFLERAEPHAWTGDEIVTAESAARQAAMAVRHAQVFQEQQEIAGRLLSLMNNVPGVVYRGLPDWTVPFVGADIERLVGYPADAFAGRALDWRSLIRPEDLPPVRDRIRGAVRAGEKVLRLEYRLRHRDGGTRWVSDRRQMVYDDRGRLAYVDGLVLDITSRKESEEALRLTQFAVDRAGDAAYWMGPDGRLLYVNEQACRVLGYTRDELLSMTIHDINPDFPPEAWPAHWEDLRRRRSYTLESRHRANGGRIIPVEITVNYVAFDGKEYNCASARDITERVRAQDESRRLQAQLFQAQKMEAVGLLAGGVAHDFNNLLTGIMGYGDLLAGKPASETDVSEAAAVIRDAASRGAELSAQLLGFAQKGKNLTVAVDLNAAVADVALLLDHTIDKRIRIARSLRAGLVPAAGDPTQIRQVVMNLAVNAGEAMPGGGTLTIGTDTVALGEDFCRSRPGLSPGRYALVTVADTGAGIPPESLEKIFDPFYTTKEPGKGTGLGLSTVYGIVRNHGGHIDVRSRVGEGAVFTVYLPLASEAALPRAEPPPLGLRPLPHGALKGRILLVDDQETVRQVCIAMLSALGYDVVAAADGAAGVERYRTLWREIDLVIVDMIMPVMGGRDCFRHMKEINPQVRAILSTGYSLEGTVQEILGDGIQGFIQKPYRLEQLAHTVESALRSAVAS